MNLKLTLVIAGVVLVGGGAAAWLVHQRQPPPRPPPPLSAHGNGIDKAMSSINALYDAPEGKSPCESAFIAFKASDDLAKTENVKSAVLRLAPRDEFLARCSGLPEATQRCLVPKYLRGHHEECVAAKPAPEVLKALVELRQADQPVSPNEPPATPPGPAPPR